MTPIANIPDLVTQLIKAFQKGIDDAGGCGGARIRELSITGEVSIETTVVTQTTIVTQAKPNVTTVEEKPSTVQDDSTDDATHLVENSGIALQNFISESHD